MVINALYIIKIIIIASYRILFADMI